MADEEGRQRPLILLPWRRRADRARRPGGPGKFERPTYERQVARLTPKFRRLDEAFKRRRAEVREELAGVEPDLALVLEVAGTIQSFAGAVREIGLEWLLDADLSEIPPDDDFYRLGRAGARGKDPVKSSFGGSLYLVMSDHRAKQELLSLWERWQRDKTLPADRKAWRSFFENLKEIRLWGPEDRLRETGLLDDWRERLQEGQETVRAEIELWFRKHVLTRDHQLERVQQLVEKAGGSLLGQSLIPEIAYHAVLAEIPAGAAQALLADRDIDLVKCEDVMFLWPVGQAVAITADGEPASSLPARGGRPEKGRPPLAAILDGLPLADHVQLRGRIEVDDPDGWAGEIQARHRNHGTAMASLILHGDLSLDEPPLKSPLHVRPVLKPVPALREPPPEGVPEDLLLVDFVHRAVRRMLVGEGEQPATAPSVLIVNLSIGDPSRPLDRFMSPLARLLDWLAWEHEILFVVSAGNHGRSLELACRREDLGSLDAEQLEEVALKAFEKEAHLRRLLSPSEAFNVLTVGGEHADGAEAYDAGRRFDPLGSSSGRIRVPSLVSAVGPGFKRAIKPEVFLPAGRQLFSEKLGTTHENAVLEVSSETPRPPGQRVASPGPASGSLAATRYRCGTSNSAALATRHAVHLCEQFSSLFDDDDIQSLPKRKYLVPLLKAFLVHGARWGESQKLLRDRLGLTGQAARAKVGRYLGFGFLDSSRILTCTDQRVTLVGWGDLGKDEGHEYQIPLPPSLAGKVVEKRVIVTLAYLTPFNPSDRRYRLAQLWVVPGRRGELDIESVVGVKRSEADHKAAARGTIQHEIFEGEKAGTFVDGDVLRIKVNCREDAGKLERRVPYGLLVTFEVAPGLEVDLPIYDEVRARVAEVKARQRQRIRT